LYGEHIAEWRKDRKALKVLIWKNLGKYGKDDTHFYYISQSAGRGFESHSRLQFLLADSIA